MANAWILDAPREQLEKYLDVPAFSTGDLFYIQKLVTAIEVQPSFSLEAIPALIRIDQAGGSASALISVEPKSGFNSQVTLTVSSSSTLNAQLSSYALNPGGSAILTVKDNSAANGSGSWTNVRVTATGGGVTQTIDIQVLVGGNQSFLPIVNFSNHWFVTLFHLYRVGKP
jgi:hypothetical protein